jgi:hypothetical protein
MLFRRTLFRTAITLFAGMVAIPALAHWLPPAAGLADVEVFDRSTGEALSVHEKDGRHYVVGQPGREYAIRITNRSAGRILAVTSVDGVNVVSGDTASPEQSGYVIDSAGSVEIAGWRKSFSRTAAFFFTEHSNSYAVRTGRPFDVGVIGVAVFAEQARRAMSRIGQPWQAERADSSAESAAPQGAAPQAAESQPAAKAQSSESMARDRASPARPLANLGTGHGRHEVSHVRQVAFQRASTSPAQIVSIQYDRRENLVAMGVLPPPHVAERSPRPFPGMRFVADPR